jgi:hypothetical protein
MITRFVFLPALLLTLLFAGTPVYAQSDTSWDTTDECKTILSLPSISPYVHDVLKRADDGLTKAHTAAEDADFRLFFVATQVGSAWASLIDSQVRLTVTADDMVHNSACLRFDMAAIECKMDQVRHEMNSQVQRGSFFSLVQLDKLLTFLNDRYTQLSIGALDPTYTDTKWNTVRDFDAPNATFNEVECPYSSDYGPAIPNGFGCDVSILKSRTDFAPLKEEYESLKIITEQLNDYRDSATQFLKVQQSIDNLFHTTSTLPSPPASFKHLTAVGCKAPNGLCNNDANKKCTQDSDCGDGNQCEFPTKMCQQNRNMTCTDDASCTTPDGRSFGPCINRDGKEPATEELRGPFSIEKNHLQLLIDYLAQDIEQGNSRLFNDTLKTPDEFSSDQSSESSERSNDAYMNNMLRSTTRFLYATWSRIQGADEAESFPSITDPALEVANSLSALRTSIGDLARLTRLTSGKSDSLRGFVVKFASFLKKTCIYRPCSDSLDEVLKIVYTDACFPYANGEFLNDSPTNPRSKQCADGAKITVP